MMMHKQWRWFYMSVAIILFDQLSKHWALGHLEPYHAKIIAPMLNFTLAYNTGAAFSFLSNAGPWHHWFFAGFSIVMSVVIACWILMTSLTERWTLCGLSLMLGGAISNLLDRAQIGQVVDFLDIYYKNYHWPVFNVADSAICIGAFMLILGVKR